MKKIFPNLPHGVRGGVKCKNGYTWFFKGKKVWAYKGNELLPNYPHDMKNTKLFPKLVLSAANKNGNVYLLRVIL